MGTMAPEIALLLHELRTPAGVIRGFVTTLRGADGSMSDAEVRQALECLDEASERLVRLLD